MHVLMVGAGGVGDAAARIAAERPFFESWVVADYDLSRAERTVAAVTSRHEGETRFRAAQVDASDAGAVEALAREVGATHVFNAVDPRFVLPLFEGAKAAGADYLDMAMSLSSRHPSEPYAKVGVKLGDDQLAQAREWEAEGSPGPGRHRCGARPVRRLRPLRRRPPLQPHRRAGHPRRRQPRHPRRGGQRGLRARASRCGRSSRSASTHRWCGSASGPSAPTVPTTSRPASSPCRRSPSPRSSTSRRASVRSSASTSSTRRCSSCRAGSRPTRSPSSTASARR